MKRIKEKKQGDVEVFEWFREHVIDSKLEPSVEHQELVSGYEVNRLCCSFVLLHFLCQFLLMILY